MENGFDVRTVREYSERQRADAERIVMLCDAAEKLHSENRALKSELEKCKAELEKSKAVTTEEK
jgi:predicted transcriptional regulator